MQKKVNLCKIIFGVWAVSLCLFLFLLRDEIVQTAALKDGYIRLMEVGVVLGISAECYIFKRNDKWTEARKISFIFFSAFGVRIAFLAISQYVPSMDFYSYFNGAYVFAHYGFKAGLSPELTRFHIPAFGGQAIFNGFLLRVLSPTLLGMQILNVVYTSGICAFIYVLGRKINVKAALIGAIFYTFYPMSILSTQITTNHHGAVFYILLGIVIYNRAVNEEKIMKRIICVIMSAVCLAISNCYHPSVIIVLCALLINALIGELENLLGSHKEYFKKLCMDVRRFRGRFCLTIVVLLMYGVLFSGTMHALENCGYIESAKMNMPWGKIIVGLNSESGGAFSSEDYAYAKELPEEERNAARITLIKERLSNPEQVAELMVEKTKDVWFRGDNYCYFYTVGIYEQIQEKLAQTNDNVVREYYEGLQNEIAHVIDNFDKANNMFIYVMWILAIVGIVVLILRYQTDREIYLLMFIPLGWMMFITFTEAQSRYRYQGMPVIILLAGIGAGAIVDGVRSIWASRIKKQGEKG